MKQETIETINTLIARKNSGELVEKIAASAGLKIHLVTNLYSLMRRLGEDVTDGRLPQQAE